VSLFAEVKPKLAGADIIFGNQEGALTDRGKPTKVAQSGRAYCFRSPPEYARFLKEAGFNMVSIANNHINDYGPDGKQQTMDVLDSNGIAWSGPTGTVAKVEVNGLKVAMAAFHTSAHSNWVNDIPGAKQLVAGLAKNNDIVIVSFHGGAEGGKALHVPNGPESFYGENRGDLRRFTHAVVDAGADLVVGHGPHVPRAMEVYKDRLIAYSLGNFCTGKGISVAGDAGLAPLLLVELDTSGRLVGGEIISYIQTFGQPPKLDSTNKAARLINRLGLEDFPKTNAVDAQGKLILPAAG
jgi:poly-gamma-glutamate capsule biosynthesis protein CapA/YwtB (metallophosphatase superfamily)